MAGAGGAAMAAAGAAEGAIVMVSDSTAEWEGDGRVGVGKGAPGRAVLAGTLVFRCRGVLLQLEKIKVSGCKGYTVSWVVANCASQKALCSE